MDRYLKTKEIYLYHQKNSKSSLKKWMKFPQFTIILGRFVFIKMTLPYIL